MQNSNVLRECILCDLLQHYINDDTKLHQLSVKLNNDRPVAGSLQDIRQFVFSSGEMTGILTDFALLALLSGTDLLPEMPGLTFKNGVLD